ncbi:SEC-C domain-containing protein [uncultured Paludibaculum sp.]|uniref:SEC-C domain-containing protein n=1 Tax=uncultured Paludibaculum sp. TaxID=1765020 RepID=UPI002AAA6296|nr:SEC-C domain-containing protein [uncultured Paludibaculum sp.]
MATDAQLIANRKNAHFSTGPRTEQGKARSSRNNLRYGFRSQSVLLPGDAPAEYEELLAELTAHFETRDLTGQRFVREMADAEWRLRRVRAHQETLLTAKIAELAAGTPSADPTYLQALAYESLFRETSFAQFLKYEAKYERQYERAHKGWLQTQNQLRPETPSPCEPIVTDEPNSSVANNSTASVLTVIPRNAPCPCGSGEKYKRCCGRHAPAILSSGANAA